MSQQKKQNKKKKKLILKIFLILTFVCIVGVGIVANHYYQYIYKSNLDLHEVKTIFFHIPTNSSLNNVFDLLYERNYIINKESFEWLVKKKNYKNHVKSGRYLLKNGMNNNELVNLLRSGNQTPVNITFNNIRTKEQLAGVVSKQIEADSLSILKLLNNSEFLSKHGFKKKTVLCCFIPNTYEFFWNTSAKNLFKRMYKEYNNFWTDKRKAKAEKIGLSKNEVSILASIVQAEQSEHNDEKPIIAGLYINRLKKKMLLQADPTLVYAIGDFTIKRILNKDKEIDSPYNTYKYVGLPPGPINLPEISSIDAVLNYKTHKYIYMCAKDDFSGYHYFAKTNAQHNIYAKRYWRALNKRKIKR